MRLPMTGYERFDVLKALFPFLDLPVRKPRPVLVVSAMAFNVRNGHVVVAMITTGAGSAWPSDYPIVDLASAGLKHRSLVRWKLFTIANAEIGGRIGRLGDTDHAAVAIRLDAILGGR